MHKLLANQPANSLVVVAGMGMDAMLLAMQALAQHATVVYSSGLEQNAVHMNMMLSLNK